MPETTDSNLRGADPMEQCEKKPSPLKIPLLKVTQLLGKTGTIKVAADASGENNRRASGRNLPTNTPSGSQIRKVPIRRSSTSANASVGCQ